MNAVQITSLEFSYPKSKTPVLNIPEFTVKSGEKIFVYGPSGSGKSTFLETLAGILTPQKGSIELLGQPFEKMSSTVRDRFRADHIGYVFQSFNLISFLSVRENIALAVQVSARRKNKVEGHLPEEIEKLASELGIADHLDRPVNRLSVGQQQRVACARALLGNPEILLADEPTSALDADHREKFVRSLFSAAQSHGSTVLFVSHDRSLEKLFDRSFAINPAFRGEEVT